MGSRTLGPRLYITNEALNRGAITGRITYATAHSGQRADFIGKRGWV